MRVCVVLLRQKLWRVAKGASAPIARRKTCVTRFRPAYETRLTQIGVTGAKSLLPQAAWLL